MIPYIMVTGYSNSGKTLVAARLITLLTDRGYKVAAVKHASKGYDVDSPGKDSWQFFQNGAREVIVAGPRSFTRHRRVDKEPDLLDLLAAIKDVDIIIVEGFKNNPGPKIQVYREGHSSGKLPLTTEVIAVVTDPVTEEVVPCCSIEELDKLADLIIAKFIN